MPDLEKQKQEFLTLCRENIHRDGLEDLLNWLQRSDFFTAPASTRYHGAYAGGLCEHSLDVYAMAKKGIAGYELDLSEESVVISALFHDLCKVNFYKEDVRNHRLFATPWTVAYQAPPSTGFSRQECWSGLPFPSSGIFPTQESNPGLPHCGQTLYRLSHQGISLQYNPELI